MTGAFVNTISKSGTHLTMMCMSLLPGIGRGLPCYGPHPYLSPDHSRDDVKRTLERLVGHDFFCGHIGFRKSLSAGLSERGIRTVVTIRDPRDVFVATLLWIEQFAGHSLHIPFATLDREERFRWLLLGAPKSSKLGIAFPPHASMYRRFLPWTQLDDVLVARYERLIGAPGGGSNLAQEAEISKIADYLGMPISGKQRKSVAGALRRASEAYNRDHDNRLRGQIGLWQQDLVPSELMARFARALKPAIKQWGYE